MLSSKKSRILIADADSTFLRSITQSLKKDGYEISTAAESDEALRLFRSFDPHAVLLGAQLADQSSLKTLERLKQLRPSLPIILLAGPEETGALFLMSKAGIDDYMGRDRKSVV